MISPMVMNFFWPGLSLSRAGAMDERRICVASGESLCYNADKSLKEWFGMKRTYLLFVLLLALGLTCAMAEDGPTVYTYEDYAYILLEDGTAEIVGYNSENWGKYGSETLFLSESMDGYVVTSIGVCAFEYCLSIRGITIPDSVKTIGPGAFNNCHYLESVVIPDGVTRIENSAFSYCVALENVTIPGSVTSIGQSAFYLCSALTDVTIPDSVTSIGDGAFSACTSLERVEIPDSVLEIGENIFNRCTALKNIYVSPEHPVLATLDGVLFEKVEKRLVSYPCAFTETSYAIPQGIQVIGGSAFNGCDSLTEVTIPESVTSIGRWAFLECTSLTGITIPEGVTSIGDRVFTGCTALTSVTLPASVTSIGAKVFSNCSPDLLITVPRDSYAAQYCKDNNLNYTYPDANDWLLN